MLSEQAIIDLVAEAKKVRKNAYAPYSNFLVGCAILLEDGRILTGVNIENASYSVILCAERSAMAQVVSLGLQEQVKAIAVVTKASPPGSPCGMCRQFLSEFLGFDVPIFLANEADGYVKTDLKELLPRPFGKKALMRKATG